MFRNRYINVSIVLFFLLVFVVPNCVKQEQKADLILRNGIFFTVDDFNPTAQAVAIKNDRILHVGKNDDMGRYWGESTKVIDLNGCFGCPGFNDAHLHFLSGGKSMTEVDLYGVNSIRDIQRRVLNKVRNWKPGEWITGRGWDQDLLPDKQWPTKRILDRIAPTVPILLRRVCGHAALVNSQALLIAGIDEETQDPPAGEIVKDPKTGQPTGILKEEAIRLVSQYLPETTEDDNKQFLELALAQASRFGITSVQDNSSVEMFEICQQLLDEGKLTCRISEWPPLQEHLVAYKKIRNQYSGNMIHFGQLKGFIDGSLGSRTAWFFDPYSDDSSTSGIPQMSEEDLNRLVLQADKEKFQIGFHAIGSAGNRMVLDAYDLARRLNGIRDSRHRIEHAQVLTQEDLKRFFELGVVASMQPAHCIDDMRWAEDRIGSRRCRFAYAWRSLLNKSAILAFGTDWPVVPLNPMLGLYAAVTRRDTLGYPPEGWIPQERISIEEAIKAYTWGSAYAEFMEKEKGTLEVGKLADIVILDRNILEVPAAELLKTKVVYTILGGMIVYQEKE